jgi:putative addiction module killer protein
VFEIRQTNLFEKWQARLKDKRASAQIVARLDRLAFGHFSDAKPVGGGVTELRIPLGPGYRVYLTQRGNTIILLLCGGTKGTQAEDILKAKQLAKDWRNSNETEDD